MRIPAQGYSASKRHVTYTLPPLGAPAQHFTLALSTAYARDDTAYHCMTANDCNERANNWRHMLVSCGILEFLGKGWLQSKRHPLVTDRIDNAHPCARILCKQEAGRLDSATSRSPCTTFHSRTLHCACSRRHYVPLHDNQRLQRKGKQLETIAGLARDPGVIGQGMASFQDTHPGHRPHRHRASLRKDTVQARGRSPRLLSLIHI